MEPPCSVPDRSSAIDDDSITGSYPTLITSDGAPSVRDPSPGEADALTVGEDSSVEHADETRVYLKLSGVSVGARALQLSVVMTR